MILGEFGLGGEESHIINGHVPVKSKNGENPVKCGGKVLVNSTKSMIGHLLGAAGGAELVTCVKELQEGFIHQTIGTETPGEGCDLNYVLGAPVKKEIRYAMSNSLGFGGHNATLLIKKFD